MNWLIDNWYLLVTAAAVVATVVFAIKRFLGLPTDQQIENFKEWLKWAVTEAEKDLGSGTGQLKLRMVYDMALSKFSWIAKLITFEEFSIWVDEALLWLNKQLESNNAVIEMVKGEDNGK